MKLIVDNGDFSKNDYQKIIHHWNNTKRNYSSNKTLAELFEEQACRTPDQIAVVYQDEHLTYQTLNQASNQLARKIQENYRHRHLKITPDTLIALCLNRRLELFIGMLAILKTGAAYVPIDTNTPPDRLRFMLQDTDSQLLLTQQNLFHQILQSAPEHTQLLTLDTINYQFEERCNLGVNATPSSLAYVIYTSGTTGLPKGVMITHRNIINYYANVSHYFDDLENVDFSTSIAFDLSVTTTLIPLLCGKKIIIYPGDLREIEKYIAHLQQKNIHFIKSTPSFLTQAFSLPQLTKIKICFVGGEKLLSTQLHCLLKNCDTVYDEYGPTENTVGTLLIQKTAELPYDSIIGKPYANHKVYVLNEKKQPVSIGVIGELYVSGAGVARGYLNQPALTAERFTLNPFTQESETMYKTGDLVRWLPDGNLEYISRNDLQVKINGYRIELNEIEYALSRFSAILQNVVLAYENSLIAHYLSKKAINQDELISHLKCWLPDYMLPQQYIHVTAFPLTVNGKVDRDALLQQPIKLNNACILAPRTALEKKLCTAWKEILGVESIGILDDFFRLGGDSIKCMQVMAHLLRDGINCRVRDIFTHRCIAQLSSVLRKNKAIVAESGVLNGDINLLPVQSWFFEQSFSSINHFNQSFLVRVPVLSVARLNAVLPQLIAHHDMLRTCFPCEKNSFRKQKYDVKKFPTEIRDFDIADATYELFTQWQSTFDIENGPLWKIAYITGYSDGSARLYFAFHHLIIDTVSWRILIDDIKRLYAGDKLTDKGSSYRQWVNVIHQYTQKYPEEYRFWENQLLENVSTTLSETAYYASFTLQAELTQQLIGPANKAYHTEINDLLLTALAQSLSDYFGKSSHCITLEGHGREEIDDNLDITRTLGWFTSMYPVILTAKENTTASILFLKEYLRSIPNKGIGYGAFKYTNVLNSRLSDLPKINFNYLGQFDNTSGYWQVVREFSGETVNANNKRPHIFDITGSVINESLHIIISTFLSKESGEIFSLLFEKKLIALANHCMSAVNDECELFTLSDFKSIKISPQLLDNLQKKDRKIEAVYPANSLQQGFIYHAISQPQNDAYRIQFLMDYYSPLDIEVYKNAWIFTIKKNPILRTYFNWDESFIQIVNTQGNFYFQLHDLTHITDKEEALSEIQKKDRLIQFDFKKPTLMRLHLIQFDRSHFVLLKNSHHSILDGWSLPILLNQVHSYYIDLLDHKKTELVVDTTYLQAQTYIAEHQSEVVNYWNTKLQDVAHINNINLLLSYLSDLDTIKTIKKPCQSILRIKKCAQETGLTQNSIIQFAWHKLIQIYTGDLQTIVGTTVSGRNIPIIDINQSIGLYINTLPLIISWDNRYTLLQQLQAIESELLELNENSFVELTKIQKNGQRLFHSLIIAEYDDNFNQFDEIKFNSRGTIEVLDYPLALIFSESKDELTIKLKYDGTYLLKEKAEALLSQLHTIILQIPHKLNLPHHHINILSEPDYQKIIYNWNNTTTIYPHDKTVHHLFEDQVLKTPDAIALVFNDEKITYKTLNNAANQLARVILTKLGNKKPTIEKLIPICFEHSFEMIVSLFAVLKAGAAYVPIDPTYPKIRINTILKEVNSAFLLTSAQFIANLNLENTHSIAVSKKLYAAERTDNLKNNCQSDKLAYVIYTSGTTGSPKGVMISHQNLINYLSSITCNDAYQKTTTSDCSSSISFDATIAILLAPLVSGRCVVLGGSEILRDTHLYLKHIKNNAIDLIRMTPSYLSVLLSTHDHTELSKIFLNLRCLILGGEKSNIADIRTWMTLIPNCRVINHYGPTETTVACSLFTINNLNQAKILDKVPLGKAAHNHQFYILDHFLQPVSIGIVGELYIGGAGVARGYLNQTELTEQRFIANSFVKNTRLYKTGDLVRWLPDGNLEFIGRNDFQIKIRGYRIELNEIEKVLSMQEHIQQCAVIELNSKLIAYYISRSPLSSFALENFLEMHLPNYMVPSIFIALDSFPLTSNGKLDKKALPKPVWSDDTSEYTAPGDELESLACGIWQNVLGATRVSIHDDFFRLGGHSILAVHAAHQMSQAMNRHVTVTAIFKYKTIAQLCTVLRTGDTLIDIPEIAENTAPLSFEQERLWFIEQYEGGTDVYHIPLVFELNATINIDALKQSLKEIVVRHEVLRTVFIQDQNGLYQQQVKDEPLKIIRKKCNKAKFALERKAFLKQLFDLTTNYPIRACLFNLTDNNTQFLMLVFHHAAFDAWSKNIFMSELQYFYNKFITGNSLQLPLPLPLLKIQYNDFAIWQRDIISQRMNTLIKYWKTTLTDYETLSFPTDYPRPQIMDYRGNAVHFQLSKTILLKLKQFSKVKSVTLYTLLLTGFAIVLSKYTAQNDIIIGTPTANRQHAQLAGLIGFFVNLLPLRIKISNENTFLQCLNAIQANLIEAEYHQDFPFATLVERLNIPRETARHPLFQIVFNLEYKNNNDDNLHWQPIDENDYNASKLDLGVSIQEREEGLFATFQYATCLFKKETIARLARHYESILINIIDSIDLPIKSYSLLNPAEYQKIIYDWNATDQYYPADKTIHELFEEQVLKTPEKIAVVYEGQQLTYRSVNEKANQLARVILKEYANDIKPDSLIAFCLNRSPDIIISMLAVLKAGAAYVPIEPNSPIDRIRYVLDDTKCKLLLTHARCVSLINENCPADTKLFVIDELHYHTEKKHNLRKNSRSSDLAYVIYTSGTTGLPKGVMVMHQGVVNIVHHIAKKLFLTEDSRVLQFASIAFDAAALQIFNPLTIGATLFIAPEKMRQDVDALGDFLKEHRITYAGLPPVLLAHLNPDDYPDLATLVVAGESSNAALMEKWRPGRYLINAYGPTENTIGASVHQYELGDSNKNIGGPLPNVKAYVLDQYLSPVAIGVIGELYLGGAGIARGYLNQDELTQERFIANPFLEGTRLYKTGDLVKWLPNGNLEFIGRNDSQVKIRGYRIELGEIEKVLMNYDGIQQCVVIVFEEKLAAYYISQSEIESIALKKQVEKYLPHYMTPSVFINLDTFPLTSNGKLDKRSLPTPVWADETTEYFAPRDELESLLCTLWKEVLHVERVGIHDDFFRLGGHSILAVHLSHKMSQATNLTITISDIFKHRNIAELCIVLRTGDVLIDITPTEKNNAPLSFAQERLWFIEQYENGTNAYHIPLLLKLDNAVSIDALKESLQAIVRRHEVLRTLFFQDKHGIYNQKIKKDELKISEKKLNQEMLLTESSEFHHRYFDLTAEYPIRVCLFDVIDKNIQFLMILFHHIAFDAWSKNIFMSELVYFYEKIINNDSTQLPILKIQYKDFSLWQRNVILQRIDILMNYWKTKLSDHELLAFPTDYARPQMMDYRGDIVSIELPKKLLEKLNSLTCEKQSTLYTILLSGFCLLLSKYTGQTDLLIGTPVVNREHPQLNNLIGLFVNSLVLRIQLQQLDTLESNLKIIQKTLIEAQRHQDLPFEQLVNGLNLTRDISRHPLFQVLFTAYDNHADSDLNAPWTAVEFQGLSQTAKFDLAVSIQVIKNTAKVSIQYASSLFKRETITRFAAHYENILNEIVNTPEKEIYAYQILNPNEYKQIIYDWNDTSHHYPIQKTIHAFFEKQAKKTPDNIALVFENIKLTYRELNEKSNQLAHFIQAHYQHKLQPGTLIGLCVERSLDLIIGILGILKSGAAYVPIDPSYLPNRIEYIINDTTCQLILTHEKLRHLFHRLSEKDVISLDRNVYKNNKTSSLPITNTSNDLAYVIYTSGTTGFPKGVMIEHRSVICLLNSKLCEGIDKKTKATLWTNIVFDVSVYEIFSLLFYGGELHILNDEVRLDDKKLFQFIIDNKISSCYFPPFFVEKISTYLLHMEKPVSIKKVLLSIEPIQVKHLAGFISKDIAITNAYGPTETTVFSTAYYLDDIKNIAGKIIPIGRPLDNESTYILDENLSPVAIGVIGELYLGGEGLARGYWKKPDLTDERFIRNPFVSDKILYKTGDLVRFLHDGNIEYIGRRDFQVKIHGMRIELGEIEQALIKHAAIDYSVVIVNEKKLVAYYTGQQIDDLTLRDYLSATLSDYMIPLAFIHIEKLPLHPNGKLNRAALPIPSKFLDNKQFIASRNDMDAKIAVVWQDILNNQTIGIHDDFFVLGGDSIASIQVISKLRYADIHCTIKDIFQYRTIARLSDHILSQKKLIKIHAEQGILEGVFDLLPIQKWFFEQSFPVLNHWNQSFLVRVPTLSCERLESILPKLIDRHDMLRIRFIKNEHDQWEQYYDAAIQNFTLKHLRNNTDLNVFQRELNITTGPLWQLAYIDGYTDNSARLFFVCHHLMIDIVSWQILITDLKRLYDGEKLAVKTSSYRQWQRALQSYATMNSDEIAFWLGQVNSTKTSLLLDKHSAHSLVINEALTSKLIDSNRAYHTKTEELLLTALSYAFCEITAEKQVTITLESHGRELIDESIDVSETVGWFTTLSPINLKLKHKLSETIESIKDKIREIPNKGIGYGALLGTKNLPSLYFNYQGQLKITANADWKLVSEKTGLSIHPDNIYNFLLLINARIVDEKLTFHFGFRLDQPRCKRFIEKFEKALTDITSLCLHQIENKKITYTSSDFKFVKTEADLYHLPLHHDPMAQDNPFEMTSIQKAYALGRLKQFEIGNVANHIYTEFNFSLLDVVKLENALNTLISSFPEMRTVFDVNNLMQHYVPSNETPHYQINITDFKIPYHINSLSAIRNQLSHTVYDVSRYPLFHFCISRFIDCDILHTSFDLLLLDAQTRMKFFTELTHLYSQKNYSVTKNTITFRDYQVYMSMIKSSAWYALDKKYWKEKLSALPLRPKLLLACDPKAIKNPHFKLNKRVIAAPAWKKFKKNAEKYGVSYSSVLLSLYGFVLSRFSENPDFLITMTLFNRYGIHPDVSNLWGDFTSTNLFGFSRKNGSAFDFFKHTHDQLWDDIAHALYTGLDVQRDLMNLHQLEPTMAISPIVFTCVIGDKKNRAEKPSYFISPDEEVDKRYWIGQTSQSWIDLQATERDGCFSSGWLYVSQLFSDDFISLLNNSYCNFIEYLAEHDWEAPLPEFTLSSKDMSIINSANATRQEISSHSLISLFELQAQLRPNSCAIIDKNGTYHYQTLQKKSQSLACELHKKGITSNQLIAVLCEKGFNQAVSTLGVMYTGAAYLPLNVEWPLGRIKDILIEGSVSHLLVSETQWNSIKNTAFVNDYHIHRIEVSAEYQQSLSIKINPNDPAYVIFTSGSTGKPKGVCISHAGAVNTILSVNKKFSINENDVVLALSELSFDLSVYDLFGVLAAGGTVVFPDQVLSKEPIHWAALIKKHKITLWNSVPQLMQLLLDNAANTIAHLRLVLLSGDWVPISLATQAKALPSQPTVVSLGGATEASIWSIWYVISNTPDLNSVPYGFPMPNQNIYVLNAFDEHCAINIAGELYLGGDGLAIEYWRDKEKTEQRFIMHSKLGRLYKTGDLGKWNPAGYVEFLGRLDNQVKRNGNRVELDEISAKLTQLNGIDNALVRIHQDRLIAYLVSSDFKSKQTDGFNIEKFKLAQHSIKTNLKDNYTFNMHQFDEAHYRSNKSYRHFSADAIPENLSLTPALKNKNKSNCCLESSHDLGLLLSALTGKKLNDKILPKYSYPSAGSTYAVQCYVNIPFQLETLQSGYYYYHPILHSLQRMDDQAKNFEFFLEFKVHRDAIEPLYRKDWLRFSYLECGHMLYLLTHLLEEKNIAYELETSEMQFANNNFLAKLILNAQAEKNLFTNKLNSIVLHKQNSGVFKNMNKSFDLNDQTISIQTSDLGNIVNSAKALIVFEGEDNPNMWIEAGFTAQYYMQYWQTQRLASCALGLRPYKNALYTLALGVMRAEDLLSAESQAIGPTLSDTLLTALSQHLPCYMLPQIFITLETLPLTANGKIDFTALPLPDFMANSQTYTAPRTDIEKTLCAVWEEVLELSNVSIKDDFFRIGGDSILCIHVTTKLRQLGMQCDVLSIFEYRSIELLAPHVKVNIPDENIKNDAQTDFHTENISDELLARLQSRYQEV